MGWEEGKIPIDGVEMRRTIFMQKKINTVVDIPHFFGYHLNG
jgi:hypothetical protein